MENKQKRYEKIDFLGEGQVGCIFKNNLKPHYASIILVRHRLQGEGRAQ